MPIILDHQLREYIPHNAIEFPITYFHDELASLADWAGPLHWHPDFEIATAKYGVLDYQVGGEHILLEAGDSIFVNKNILHGIRQLSGSVPDPMPNIVFSGTLIAPEASTIYQNHILPIAQCDLLPFVVFRRGREDHREINSLIQEIYGKMSEQEAGFELAVQRNLNRIFEFLSCRFDDLPKTEESRIQIKNQIRLQKMLAFIYENYARPITLEDIAKAANISRSEAGRCFQACMGTSPIDVLIQYRLQTAHALLAEKTLSMEEISSACGFHSANYFSRQFKRFYGYSPRKKHNSGK